MIPRTRSCVAAKEKKNFFTLLPNSTVIHFFSPILLIFYLFSPPFQLSTAMPWKRKQPVESQFNEA